MSSKKATATVQGTTGKFVPTTNLDGTPSRSIAKGACLDGYLKGLGRTAKGKPTFDIADQVADTLRGLSAADVAKLCRDRITKITGSDPGDLLAKYEHLNPGQIRMNCGNRLRAAIKADVA